jgi:hypothetical protein
MDWYLDNTDWFPHLGGVQGVKVVEVGIFWSDRGRLLSY